MTCTKAWAFVYVAARRVCPANHHPMLPSARRASAGIAADSSTPTEMKVYRVYRDPDLFAYLLDRYTLFYACMKRGCDILPRMGKAEKSEVLAHINASDENTRYDFWTYLEPGSQKGRWEGPPHDPFATDSDGDDSPLSKRPRKEDGTTDVPELQPDGEGVRSGAEAVHGTA